MTNNVSCIKHSDCDYFDCKGQCDLFKNKCITGVVNNNLQVSFLLMHNVAKLILYLTIFSGYL